MTTEELQRKADLLWSINSPPLLAESPGFELSQEFQQLPKPPKSHRVGYYFESLVEFWLKEIRGVEIEASGLQIQDGKKTLGELDIVFRDENRLLIHWEIAVKFYLHYPHENHTGSHYIGPNAGDTLERKYKRFTEHQLPLGRSHLPDVERQSIFTRGRIFYRPESDEGSLSPLLDPGHLRGSWLFAKEADQLRSLYGPDAHYTILQKPHWLALPEEERQYDQSFEAISRTLANHFEKSDHPILMAALNPDSGTPEPVFIVNNHWPEKR